MRMRIWTSLCIVLILTACASRPVELPEWDIAEIPEESIQDPSPLPILCELQRQGDIVGWNARCAKIFMQYEAIAEGNYTIALHNASALRKVEKASQHIVTAAQQQREIAVIRQDLLEQERQDHFIDNITHRILLVLALVGYAL